MRYSTRIWSIFLATFLTTTALSLGLLHVSYESRGPTAHAFHPRALLPLSPGLAEILWNLGLGDRIVAVTDNTRYPSQLRLKPHVGGFLTPNLELILRAAPDLVICNRAQSDIASKLKHSGISTLVVADSSLSDIFASIRLIGRKTGVAKTADGLIKHMQKKLKELRSRANNLRTRPRVLIVVGRADETLRSIYAAGPRTILGELLRLSGGKNAVSDSVAAYPVVSPEFLASSGPDLIIEINVPPAAMPEATIVSSWHRLPDVASGRTKVVVVKDPSWLIPGPRLLDAARSLQDIMASLHSNPHFVR